MFPFVRPLNIHPPVTTTTTTTTTAQPTCPGGPYYECDGVGPPAPSCSPGQTFNCQTCQCEGGGL